jgi:hypothetical protein
MKKYIYFILLLTSVNLFAQTPDGNIKTPKGNDVEYYNGTLGDTASYRVYAESLINDNDWDATIVSHATGKYNCHSYAWHTSEGGSDCWVNGWDYGTINYTNPNNTPTNTADNINEYWTSDGGYHDIPTKQEKAKVHYGSQWVWESTYFGFQWINKKDHSAIVDSNTDYFISKWGKLPRFKHKPADCPYTASSLTYYKLDNPIITGSTSELCNNIQRTFSETDLTDIDLDYDWNYTSPLAEVSDDDENAYTVKGTSQDGMGTVSLTITTPSGITVSSSKNVYVGNPDPDDIDIINIGPNYPGSMVLCDDMPNDGKVNWTKPGSILEYSWSIYDDGGNYWQVNQHPMEPFPDIPMKDVQFSKPYGSVNGYVNVIVRARNTCSGWGEYSAPAMQFSTSSCGGMYLMLSPNPTSGEAIVSIEAIPPRETASKQATVNINFDETAEWELEVYDNMQRLKHKKTDIKATNEVKLNTQGWQGGVYMVRVKYKGQLLTGKLVVK